MLLKAYILEVVLEFSVILSCSSSTEEPIELFYSPSTAPKARSVAFCDEVKPLTPVMFIPS